MNLINLHFPERNRTKTTIRRPVNLFALLFLPQSKSHVFRAIRFLRIVKKMYSKCLQSSVEFNASSTSLFANTTQNRHSCTACDPSSCLKTCTSMMCMSKDFLKPCTFGHALFSPENIDYLDILGRSSHLLLQHNLNLYPI